MPVSADVRIYVTGWCPYCVAAKRLLTKKGAAFTEIDVDGRDDLRSWLVSTSGQRTVPQIFVNGAPLGGFTDIAALDDEGKLDALLAAAPPAGAPALPQ
jgi:glutaredoxin 3